MRRAKLDIRLCAAKNSTCQEKPGTPGIRQVFQDIGASWWAALQGAARARVGELLAHFEPGTVVVARGGGALPAVQRASTTIGRALFGADQGSGGAGHGPACGSPVIAPVRRRQACACEFSWRLDRRAGSSPRRRCLACGSVGFHHNLASSVWSSPRERCGWARTSVRQPCDRAG
jgi:hypothetical protein